MKAFLVAAALLAAAPAAASPFSQIVIFGDSLSDVGNNGRFTDKYLWDEHVAGGFGLAMRPSTKGGTDYAYSGALITADVGKIPSLPHQLAAYLAAHPKADGKALYVIWGGGNDVFSTIANPGGSAKLVQQGVADTVAMIQKLASAGARSILVGDVPRTDLTPYVRGLGKAVMAQQLGVVTSWNGALAAALGKLHGPARVQTYDAAGGLAAIVVSPTHYNFTDYTTPCDGKCADPDHTFFWDAVHPASFGHAFIGSAVLAVLSQ